MQHAGVYAMLDLSVFKLLVSYVVRSAGRDRGPRTEYELLHTVLRRELGRN